MSTGPHIRAVGENLPDENRQPAEETLELDQPIEDSRWDDWEDEMPDPASRRWLDWVLPAIFVSAALGWTGFYAWIRSTAGLSGASADQWIGWTTQWAIPILLIVSLWLLAMRLSRREAARFGDAAAALAGEARALEDRLTVVNRELSLAREFLGEQTRELDFLGRTATDRLSTHADRLQALIQDNGTQVDAIAAVSTTAVENMDKLRDDLPVIANSARDVTNRIGGAGREAQIQLDDLATGFEKLDAAGKASEEQVTSVRARVDQAIAAFDAQTRHLDEIAETRFALLREKSEEFRTELSDREVDALAAMRHRAAKLGEEIDNASITLETEEEEALKSLRARLDGLRDEAGTISRSIRNTETAAGEAWEGQIDGLRARLGEAIEEIQRIDAVALENAQAKMAGLRKEAEDIDAKLKDRNSVFAAELEKRQRTFAEDEAHALASLHDRLGKLDEAIAERRADQIEKSRVLAEGGEALATRIDELGVVLDAIAAKSGEVEATLGGSVDSLQGRLADSRNAIADARTTLTELTEASVRMLELIQAGSQHSKGELVESIGSAGRHLQQIEERGEALRLMLEGSEERGKALSDYVIRARDVTEETAGQISQLHENMDQRNRQHLHDLAKLQERLISIGEESEALAERSRSELREAIGQLEEAARNVGTSLSETSRDGIAALAEQVGEESAKAVDRALNEHTRQSIADLEDAASRASSVSRDAAAQLRNQLAKVDELAGNLESRVARARERAEEQTGNDFARRMALITESLNSNAIDIAKALSSEVPDTTWAAYLRGDRGIFTRRAVRLVDNIEARDIAEIYDSEPEFRDQVGHYVADFEAMLRSVLSTRDGNALGVTLLGSDVGKLYVILAQAIERLRE